MTSQPAPSFLCNSASASPCSGGTPPLHGTQCLSASSLIMEGFIGESKIDRSTCGRQATVCDTDKCRSQPFNSGARQTRQKRASIVLLCVAVLAWRSRDPIQRDKPCFCSK